MSFENDFKDKKITVVGLGLLGRGIGDIRFLAQAGAELIVTDLKSEAELKNSVEALSEFPEITYHLGGHQMEDFEGRDLIVKGPRVPMNSPYIAEAKKHNIPVTMSTALFVKLAGMPTIGITGTRGKSTVTHLLYDIVRRAGRPSLLGGNVVGISTLSLLPEARSDGVAVLELDSWQLQGFAAEEVSPKIAVFTNLLEDHLDYYCGLPCPSSKYDEAMDAYLADKANIFLYQSADDTLVLGKRVAALVKKKYGRKIRSNIVIADPDELCPDWELPLKGEHNRENVACAIAAARAYGIDDGTIRGAIADFHGMPGRLEFIREHHGRRFFNDTTATTPEATIAGLKALDSEGQRLVLILGGADKGLATDELLKLIPHSCKKAVLIEGTGTSRILPEIQKMFPDAKVHADLGDALQEAIASSQTGDTILFSPAFASFGMFENEYDRGAQFVRLVKELQ